MKCPHCGKGIVLEPTERQLEAYRLVRVEHKSQDDAADMMGITQGRVSQLLAEVTKILN